MRLSRFNTEISTERASASGRHDARDGRARRRLAALALLAVLAPAVGQVVGPGPARASSPPANTVAPALTPTVVTQTGTLTVTDGTWTENPNGYAYTWFRCTDSACSTPTLITGATTSSYSVRFTDAARFIVVEVTATNADGSSAPVRSNVVGPVLLQFEETAAGNVVLGDLASRTQRKPISVGGAVAPFTVIGTDSLTGDVYSYLTDVNYRAQAPQQRESDERSASGTYSRTITNFSGRNSVQYLRSILQCANTPDGGSGSNSKDGFQTYCAVFGPEVWTLPFDAASGQALAFDYAASASDNYEVYAFLVAVTCTDQNDAATCDYGGAGTADALSTHTLVLHRRGKTTTWTTATGDVPSTGRYRFRFVDGSYDATGGFALGTDFYIDPTSIVVGAAQTITFTQPDDALRPGPGDETVTVSVSNSSPLPVTVTSLTTSVCTVSGTTVTLIATGTCTLRADAAGGESAGTTFVAASTVVRSFTVLAAAVAPSNTGLPVITGTLTTGATLTAQVGTWGDGGSPITSTAYQWFATVEGVRTAITGATGGTLSVPCDLIGATLNVEVTRTNAVGSTTATSSAVGPLTEGECSTEPEQEPSPAPAPSGPAPAPVSDPGGGLPVMPPGGSSGSVGGVPTAPSGSIPSGGVAEFRVGSMQARIDLAVAGAGDVRGTGTGPSIRAVRDRAATIAGGGMRPGEIIEVWMPLPGGGSRQIALLPVGADGTFDSVLPFTGELDGRGPLPIGDRTIQLFGIDENGQLTALNIGVRIEQPGPVAPEPDRGQGAPPSLSPGQSLATNAGIPTPVTVTPLPDARSTRIEGDGWLMDVDVPDGSVLDENGAPIIEIVLGDRSVVRGTGFMPGTLAYVWLMSTPTFLGQVTVGADGTFNGTVPVTGVEVGLHTLQLSGVGTDGFIRAANLGVIITGDGQPRPNRVNTGGGPVPILPLPAALVLLTALAAVLLVEQARSSTTTMAPAHPSTPRTPHPGFDRIDAELTALRSKVRRTARGPHGG